jgi:hypothetical protein
MHSNFISPPDILELEQRQNHSVLVIDPNQKTVLDLGMICKTAGTDFDVYLYADIFDDLKWLETVFNLVDTVLINTEPSKISPIKDRLVEHQKAYHYGPKRFLSTAKHIKSAQEYFLLYIQNQQKIDLSE